MVANNRYIITGGPGSGKSSLLNALIRRGYQGFEEISRVVIREQHQINGDKLPWKNLADFAEICFERMEKQLNDCYSTNFCFYDRGIPDIIAYVRRGKLKIPKKYFEKCKQYNSIVFIAPPWQDIFINDAERPESFSDSLEIYHFLKDTYLELGFNVVELPKISIQERVDFIENYLA
ncbi:MAG: AAA family ATPase [Marinifilum sp.]|jgi:predicted ATPase|nr:AAA family ATPase [Marinifilum sp.]